MLTYWYKQLDLNALNGTDTRGGILSSLYYWGVYKAPLLHQNLVHNEDFRNVIKDATRSGADDWYELMTRNDGDDVAADRRLLGTFNRSPLVDGSNAFKKSVEIAHGNYRAYATLESVETRLSPRAATPA